jgi:hypothetical protein
MPLTWGFPHLVRSREVCSRNFSIQTSTWTLRTRPNETSREAVATADDDVRITWRDASEHELMTVADTCTHRIPGRTITCPQPVFRDQRCYFHWKRLAGLLGPAPEGTMRSGASAVLACTGDLAARRVHLALAVAR